MRMKPGHPQVKRRAGFGLLELTVSLVVGGMAVTGAAALLLGLGSRADAVRVTARAVDRDANAERMLRLLTTNVDATADTILLRGDRASVQFPTWCETGFEWSERCRVRLAFRASDTSRWLVVERLSDARGAVEANGTVIRRGVRAGHFLYLVSAASGGKWATSWSTITLPAALGIVIDGDTLILPVR